MGRGQNSKNKQVKNSATPRTVIERDISSPSYKAEAEEDIKLKLKKDLAEFLPDTDFDRKIEKVSLFMKRHNEESVALRMKVYGPMDDPHKIRPENPNWGDINRLEKEARAKFVDEFITTDYSGSIPLPKELDDKVLHLMAMYTVRRISWYGDPSVGTGIYQDEE